jgi:hypothetical protein
MSLRIFELEKHVTHHYRLPARGKLSYLIHSATTVTSMFRWQYGSLLALLAASSIVFATAASRQPDFPGGSISQADQVEQPAKGCEDKAVYEGLDDKGRVVRLTLSDLHVQAFERVTPPSAAGHSEPHCSSLFGTGTAAEAERQK